VARKALHTEGRPAYNGAPGEDVSLRTDHHRPDRPGGRSPRVWQCFALLHLAFGLPALSAADDLATEDDATALAASIDRLIEARLDAEGLQRAPQPMMQSSSGGCVGSLTNGSKI
jgi:hypothetical protein